jgi:hypothetical protein
MSTPELVIHPVEPVDFTDVRAGLVATRGLLDPRIGGRTFEVTSQFAEYRYTNMVERFTSSFVRPALPTLECERCARR